MRGAKKRLIRQFINEIFTIFIEDKAKQHKERTKNDTVLTKLAKKKPETIVAKIQ